MTTTAEFALDPDGRVAAAAAEQFAPPDPVFSNWTEDLEIRRQFLGGSDAPEALGESPYRGPVELWLEKTGRDQTPVVETDAMFWGSVLEPSILRGWSLKSGREVWHPVATWKDQTEGRGYRAASTDGFSPMADGRLEVLETKAVSERIAHFWEEDAPDWNVLQAIHNADVLGAAQARLIALIGGRTMKEFVLNMEEPRVAAAARMLRDETAEFWGIVQANTEPPKTKHRNDLGALAGLWTARESSQVDLSHLAAEIARHRAIADLINSLKEEQADLAADIARAAGDAYEIRVHGDKVGTYANRTEIIAENLPAEIVEKFTTTQEVTDLPALAKAHPKVWGAKENRRKIGRQLRINAAVRDLAANWPGAQEPAPSEEEE